MRACTWFKVDSKYVVNALPLSVSWEINLSVFFVLNSPSIATELVLISYLSSSPIGRMHHKSLVLSLLTTAVGRYRNPQSLPALADT